MRVLIAHWGSFGDVFPYIGLGRALRDRGHGATLAAPAFYRELIEAQGLGFHPVPPDIDANDTALVERVLRSVRGPEILIRDLLMPTVGEAFETLREAARDADALVTHPAMFAGPVVADAARLPWAATVLAPLSFFSAHDLPALPGLPWLAPLGRLGPRWGRLVLALVRRRTAAWSEPVRRLRARLGLPRRGDPIHEGQFSPHLNLALYSPLLGAPQPDWPPHTEATGFVFHDASLAMPEALEAFLAAGPAPVVFTLGSSVVGAPGRFFDESVEAARRLGVRAVLMVGPHAANRRDGLPAGMLAVESAPHARLFPRAAAVVHHGGVGTTGQALRAGRPMLVVPHAFDQPDNALRAERLGVARVVPAHRYTARRAAAAIEALLTDARHARRAQEVGYAVRAERGAERAAEAIEKLVMAPACAKGESVPTAPRP